MLDMESIKRFSIDKSSWQKVKFGDVVYEPKESVKDPVAEGIEHVVGLEHIDSEDIHLRRSASVEESTTFIKKFCEGDVLFGRRRAYLKKAAKADFEGICSGDITVMRSNDTLMPELLPFIVNNERFFDFAITHSAGGLSPRVKFKDLSDYEFFIPPKAKQDQLAELLWSVDDMVQKSKKNEESLHRYYSIYIDNLFSVNNESWDYISLNTVAKINQETLSSKTDENYEFNYLDLTSMQGPKLLGDMKVMQYGAAPSRARRIVRDNSTIIALVRPYQQAIVYVDKANDIVSSTGTAVVNAKTGINNRFLFHQFFSIRFLRFCERMMTGTNYPAITTDDLALYKVALPKNQSFQDEIAEKLDRIEASQIKAREAIQSNYNLHKCLLSQVF